MLSALCLRSKAVWGYGSGFMEACRSELTIQACELQSTSIAVAEENGKVVGVAQVKVNGAEADLLKLFVEPTMLRGGVGMQLFHWATSEATAMGAYRMLIEADPDAATVFYRRMGTKDAASFPPAQYPAECFPSWLRSWGRSDMHVASWRKRAIQAAEEGQLDVSIGTSRGTSTISKCEPRQRARFSSVIIVAPDSLSPYQLTATEGRITVTSNTPKGVMIQLEVPLDENMS